MAVFVAGQIMTLVSAQGARTTASRTTVDPSGTWVREYDWYDARVEEVTRLKLTEDGKVVGTLSLNDVAYEIENAKLKGNELSFSISSDYQGTAWTTSYTGIVKGDVIDGTVVLKVGEQSWDFAWIVERIGQTLAFPGAEGYGRFAKGGRGGDVYHVTNLNDSGAGSVREGIESAEGPRTIVFDVSGTIELKSRIKIQTKWLTIAGQTAPGDGITFKDITLGFSKASDIIVRYIRVRLGDKNKPRPSGPDAVAVDDCDNVIFDHVSISWGIDGNQDTGNCKNYTFQWSILSEGLHDSLHHKGPHGMCGSFRRQESNITIHHSIFASSRSRHPSLSGNQDEPNWIIDFRNNIVYNWSAGGTANVGDAQLNLINNIFRPGPETGTTLPIAMKCHTAYAAHGYMSGNVFDERPELTADNYAAIDMELWAKNYQYLGTLEHWKVDKVFETGSNAPVTHSAEEARRLVLAGAGASLVRDAVDKRLVNDINNRTGKLLDSQDEVGGWPELKSKRAPKDADRDGMADTWETANNLDPKNPEDRNGDADEDGYTNLEEYLNSLCP
ncbi:MAG: pectate lyase family protein, partial [Planctomycetota bacterium]|jgi:pectate lyase